MKTTVNNIYLTLVLWLCTAATAQATILPTYSQKGKPQTYIPADNLLRNLQKTATWENMYKINPADIHRVEHVGTDLNEVITPYNLYLNKKTKNWNVRSFGSTISASGHFSALQMSRDGSTISVGSSGPVAGGPRRNSRPNGNPMGGVNTPIGDTLIPLLIALLMYTIVVARRRTKETLQ